jgi:hypothetical protein
MVSIPIVNTEVFVADLCKYSSGASNDGDIIELLGIIRKSILAGDLNAKHKFWNSVHWNPSGGKLWNCLL